MTIYFRDDSDNVTHQVWAQRQFSSCAVASIWMARNQARQMTFAEGEWELAWRIYGQVVQGMDFVPEPPPGMSLDPSVHPADQTTFENMFASAGTFMPQVAEALRNDGLTVSTTNFSKGSTVDSFRLSDTTPAIILLGWYTGTTRNGGHFIVASRRTSRGNIVYLDPWEGQLRELGVGPAYQRTGQFEQFAYISA
jgi:hypothetical protein